jgi:hypothetical protein
MRMSCSVSIWKQIQALTWLSQAQMGIGVPPHLYSSVKSYTIRTPSVRRILGYSTLERPATPSGARPLGDLSPNTSNQEEKTPSGI